MTLRPHIDLYFARMANLVATRSTCARRAVGCVLVDVRQHVLATGYNGVARGVPHCNERVLQLHLNDITGSDEMVEEYAHPCPGFRALSKALPGTQLDTCDAVHAEQNALLQCSDTWAIQTCYITVSPCVSCMKMLLNTSCKRIVVRDWYPGHGHGLKLWHEAGRYIERIGETL